jgi:hypothetical protein
LIEALEEQAEANLAEADEFGWNDVRDQAEAQRMLAERFKELARVDLSDVSFAGFRVVRA